MKFIHLYLRVLNLLGTDRKLGWILALANVTFAMALFAEPVLFGMVVDSLTQTSAQQPALVWDKVWPLLAAWAAVSYTHLTLPTIYSV